MLFRRNKGDRRLAQGGELGPREGPEGHQRLHGREGGVMPVETELQALRKTVKHLWIFCFLLAIAVLMVFIKSEIEPKYAFPVFHEIGIVDGKVLWRGGEVTGNGTIVGRHDPDMDYPSTTHGLWSHD